MHQAAAAHQAAAPQAAAPQGAAQTRQGRVAPDHGERAQRVTQRSSNDLCDSLQALARLSLRTEVRPDDVRESQRLIKASVHSAGDADVVMDLPEDDAEPEDVARLWLGGDEAAADADAGAVDAAMAGACANVACACC